MQLRRETICFNNINKIAEWGQQLLKNKVLNVWVYIQAYSHPIHWVMMVVWLIYYPKVENVNANVQVGLDIDSGWHDKNLNKKTAKKT